MSQTRIFQKGLGSLGLIGEPTVPPGALARQNPAIGPEFGLAVLTRHVSLVGRPSSKLRKTLGTIITLSPPIGVFKLLFDTFNRNNGVSGKQSQPTSLVTLFLMNRNPIVFHPLTIKVAQRPHGFFGVESSAMSSNRPFFDLKAQRREAMRAQRATPGPLGFRKVRGSSDRNIRGLTMEKGRVNLRMFTADMEISGLRNSRISAFYDQPTGVDRAGPRPRHGSAPFRALTRVGLLSPEAHFDLSGSSAFPENRSFPGRLFQSRILRKNLRCKENHRFLFSSSILRSLSSRSIALNGAVRFPC